MKPRLFQPNLTCTYVLTATPDQRMRVLTVINKDDIGIIEEQLISSLWSWVKEFSRKLREANVKPPEEIPSTEVILNLSHDFTAYSVACMSTDKVVTLSDMIYAIIMGNFCSMLAQHADIQLEGLENGIKATNSNGRGQGIQPEM